MPSCGKPFEIYINECSRHDRECASHTEKHPKMTFTAHNIQVGHKREYPQRTHTHKGIRHYISETILIGLVTHIHHKLMITVLTDELQGQVGHKQIVFLCQNRPVTMLILMNANEVSKDSLGLTE